MAVEIEQVEVYEVNGYLVCTKEHKDLKEYLSDIPEEYYHKAKYMGLHYVIACGKEFVSKRCMELRHMKFNVLYKTEEMALQQAM